MLVQTSGRLWVILLLVLSTGCGSDRENIKPRQREAALMPPSIVDFTDQEKELLRHFKIAIFRNKVILDAQPPITSDQLAQVAKKANGNLPPDLVALWTTSFGGALDYDYEILFGDHLYTASLRELFYPGSPHYHDLYGWIEHEIEAAQEAAEESGKAIPQRTSFMPFGGFEYLERFYVSLKPDEYGAVIVYAQGIPWKGRLNENSVASVATSVAELFDQLSLNADPFAEDADESTSGRDMVAQILELETEHPELARKLKSLVRSSVFDWRSIIETRTLAAPLSAEESKALRLALKFSVQRQDVGVIDQLHQKGAPFDVVLHGTGGVLSFAMAQQAFEIVDHLLRLQVDLGNASIIHAAGCSDDLLLRLIKSGVRFDEEAIYSAAETGATKGAIALVNSEQVDDPQTIAQVTATALKRADRNDGDAVKVETGKLGSYLTADQYRERAQALREFARQLEAGF